MMKKSALVLVLLIILVALFGYIWRWDQPGEEYIRISGNIEVTEVQLSFKIPGKVTKRWVDEGQYVNENAPIAALDQQDLVAEKELRQAQMHEAQAGLNELEQGYLPEEVAQAVARLEQSEAEVHRLQQDFERQRKLYQQDVISTREFEASQAAFDVAMAKKEEAEKYYHLLLQGTRREKIFQGQARLKAAEKAVDLAQIHLDDGTIYAPFSGYVLVKNVEEGEYVNPGTPVITMANLNQVWLRAYINETDLGKVKLGKSVEIKTDTYPDKTYRGKISFISSEAEFTPKNIQTEKERVKLVYRIKIAIDNDDLELKPGMPADGTIGLTHD